jgi:prenylcysteine alpha-carboxyl methylesterase
MWGALLARALNAAGIVVVIPDMRNYPWASVPAMVADVDLSLAWTLKNIADYGGDPEKIVIVGQSAGGHVACTALLQRAKAILMDDHAVSTLESGIDNHEQEHVESWRPTDFKGFASLSAPYSLTAMQQTFMRHGLDENLVDRIFGGDQENFDPHRIVLNCQRDGLLLSGLLPPIQIYHGSLDRTVPHEGSVNFCTELQNTVTNGQQVSFTSYEGWSHTDPILEGPMDADHRFHNDLFRAVKEWTDSSHLEWPENDPLIKQRLCPHFLVQAGRFCNPI